MATQNPYLNLGVTSKLWLGWGASNMVGQPSPFGLAPHYLSQRALWCFLLNGSDWRTWLSLQQRNNSFGPEMSFCWERELLGEHILFPKFAQSGSVLATDWRVAEGDGLFDDMLSWMDTQIERCPVDFDFTGTLIGNGYSDGLLQATADAYQDNMELAFSRLRTAFGAGLRMVFTRIPAGTGAPFETTIRDAQDALGLLPNCYMVDTDGIPTSDGIHWTQAGQITVGDRYAVGATP